MCKPESEAEVSPGRDSACAPRTGVRGPAGDPGREPLWSFHRWEASDSGGTDACAMLPALRAKDSVASQSQDSTKVSKRHSQAAEGVECVGRIMFLHVRDWKIS